MVRRTTAHNAPNPTAEKTPDMVEKRGKASLRQGTRYGSREAGRGSEHFERAPSPDKHHTHGSRKASRSKSQNKRSPEQRIVSG